MIKEQPTKFEEQAIARMKDAGYRITGPRVLVARVLAGAETALSAYQIHSLIKESGGTIDVVSVYRILETLKESGLVYSCGDGNWFRREAGSGILAFNGEKVLEAKENPNLAELVNAIASDLGVRAESFQLRIKGVA